MNRFRQSLCSLLLVTGLLCTTAFSQPVSPTSSVPPIVVEAAANVTSILPIDGQAIVVRTGAAAGLFYYDIDSVATVDGTSVLNGPSGKGRYLCITAGTAAGGGFDVVNVSDYSATGDGVTDDTAELQAAVDALPASGGILYFPIGTYIVNDTAGIASVLFTSKTNFHIVGHGATIKAANSMPTNGTNLIMAFDECTDFTVGGLCIDGNRTPRTEFEGDTHNLYIRSCQRFRFSEVKSINACSDGVILVTADNTDTDTFCKDGAFVDCKFDNAYRDGVSVINGWDIHFVTCTFSRANGTAPKAGCNVESDPGATMPANRSVTFTSCRFTDNEGYGLQSGHSTLYATGVVVDGCYFSGNADGSEDLDNMTAIHSTASGLVVTNSLFDGSRDGIHSQVNDCRIENNQFRNVTDVRTDSPAIIYINPTSNGAIVRGNRFTRSDFRRTIVGEADDDTLTATNHGLQEHVTVTLIEGGTLPSPLATATTYYVVSPTLNTFKLSLTYGGAAINLTTDGTGTNYAQTSTLAAVLTGSGSIHNIVTENSVDSMYLAFNINGPTILSNNMGSNLFYAINSAVSDHIVTNNRFNVIAQSEAVVLSSGSMQFANNYLSSVRPKVRVITGATLYATDNEFVSSSPSTWDAFEVEGTATIDGVTTTGYTSLAAIVTLDGGTATVKELRGAGSPEGVVSSSIGGRFLRTDGGVLTTLYTKESGAGNTGWVAQLGRNSSGEIPLGTATDTAPLTISQTWNDGADTFEGVKVKVTDTASAAASLPFQVLGGAAGSTNLLSVNKSGVLNLPAGSNAAPTITFSGTASAGIFSAAPGLISIGAASSEFFRVQNGVTSSFNSRFLSSGTIEWGSGNDCITVREAANHLALRNSTNAQSLSVYNAYTSGSVYERGRIGWDSNVLKIGTEHVGGVSRTLALIAGGTTRLSIDPAGDSTFTGSVNAVGDFRATQQLQAGNGYRVGWSAATGMYGSTDGRLMLLNAATTGFDMLQLGGLTSSKPAIKVSGTGLQIRLADDSASSYVLSKRLVEANTAGVGSPNVITEDETSTVYTNEGVTAKNYHTLPAAVAGLTITVIVADADGLRVTATGDDVVRLGPHVTAAAGYVESTTIGDTVTLVAINATTWVATSAIGTWTDGTFTFTDVSST